MFYNNIITLNNIINVRGLRKKFVEFVIKNKSTRVVALKFLLVLDPFKPDKI